ncbi:MAG: site-2 protease family protein [Hyphomicrobiaceae bacterium]
MKWILLLLNASKLGPALWSSLSIVASIWVYAQFLGWPFAVGFVGLIFVHELGHYLAARDRGLDVGLPVFVPFVGAWIALREQPMNAQTEAYIAYAGPFVGTIGAYACFWYGRAHGDLLFLVLAKSGFILNLFNLIPVSPLDGGRITAVLTPRVWLLGVPCLLGLWLYWPSPMLILVAVLAAPQIMAAWRYDPALPENHAYYGVPLATRALWASLYLGLVLILVLFIQETQALLPRRLG